MRFLFAVSGGTESPEGRERWLPLWLSRCSQHSWDTCPEVSAAERACRGKCGPRRSGCHFLWVRISRWAGPSSVPTVWGLRVGSRRCFRLLT